MQHSFLKYNWCNTICILFLFYKINEQKKTAQQEITFSFLKNSYEPLNIIKFPWFRLYIWKQTRSVLVVKGNYFIAKRIKFKPHHFRKVYSNAIFTIEGRRFVPNTDIMDYNQLQSSLDREDPGYTSPGNEEQQRAIGHRSEYMTTRSLEIAEMSTVYVTSLN